MTHRTGDRLVMVDAGMGPAEMSDHADDPCRLYGGQLPVGLRALGVRPADVTDVVCTHLHPDHVGWLFDGVGSAVFPSATIWFGGGRRLGPLRRPGGAAAAGPRPRGPTAPENQPRLRLLDGDTAVALASSAIMTPGHTPGHLSVVVSSAGHRALLLGDAITCPVQLDEPTWHSIGDVDPALADRTRERLWQELEGEDVTGTGAHFPELAFGRVLRNEGRRWWKAVSCKDHGHGR